VALGQFPDDENAVSQGLAPDASTKSIQKGHIGSNLAAMVYPLTIHGAAFLLAFAGSGYSS
jgi:hypothetical protein